MIDPAQSLITLQGDLEKIADVIQEEGWGIAPWPLQNETFFVSMKSKVDNEGYTLRLVWDGYPDEPPSIKCVNPSTKDPNDPKGWPNCDGFRPPPNFDLCLNISREAFRQLHPDWARDSTYAWDASGNPAWRVLAALQDRINDRSKYHGRY